MTKQLTSILLLLVGIAASATAQTKSTDPRSIQKGSAVWGLNFNYTNHNQTLTIQEVTGTGLYGTYEDKGISQLGASGQIGWFVRNRLMLGANVDFLLQPKQYNRAVDSNATGSHLAAGILARYYIPISDKLTFVPEASWGYKGSSIRSLSTWKGGIFSQDSMQQTYKLAGTGGYAGAGLLFAINKKTAFELSARYHWANEAGTDVIRFVIDNLSQTVTAPTSSVRSGAGVRLGFQRFF